MHKKLIAILMMMFILSGVAFSDETVEFSEETRFMFKSLTMGDGLSNGTVYTIAQDSRGIMWFGTDYLLNMYDGTAFEGFEHFGHISEDPNSLASDSASNIMIDRRDTIWVGTWGAGLDRLNYQTGSVTHYQHNTLDPNSLSDNRVQTVFEASDGTIWVGTYEGGLNKLDIKSGTFTRYQSNPRMSGSISSNRIWSICEDSFGNLVIATSNGLNYMDVKKGKFEYYQHNPENPKSIASSFVRTVYMDENDQVWVGTDVGISLFDIDSRSFNNYFPNLEKFEMLDATINALLIDDDGTLWVGGVYGLLEFDRKTRTFVNHYAHQENDVTSLVHDNVRGLYQDRSGLIWVGTRGGGISTFNPKIKFSYLESTVKKNIRTVYATRQDKLLICRDDGVYRYDPKTARNNLVLNKKANALVEDSNGDIWIGMDQGILYRYRGNKVESIQIKLANETEKTAIVELLAIGNQLWIGTFGSGVYVYDIEQSKVIASYTHSDSNALSLSGNEIWSMYQDSQQNIWIGTQNGVSLFDKSSGQFSTYLADFIYDFYEDAFQQLWMGSRDGLLSLNMSEIANGDISALKVDKYNHESGLVSNIVYGVQGDETGSLWLSTEYGITKFNKDQNQFINFNRKNGLRHEKFISRSSTVMRNGQIFFGSTNGITTFNPEDIGENHVVPKVLLTYITVNGEPYGKTENDPYGIMDGIIFREESQLSPIRLTHKDVFFSFEFAATDYINSQSNQYAYMLEGFDQDWIYSGNRTYASYTNIQPGDYTFRVKAANSYGIWNETGVSIPVIINPPWWNTWIFKVFAFLSVVFIIIGWYLFRVRRLERRNRLLMIMVEERTKKLAQVNEELQKIAAIDSLTQLKNRGFGDRHLETHWKMAQREQNSLSILLIDIDYFKAYNDFYGHLQGDECLKAFASLINQLPKRPLDVAYRYGGEEFMIVLPNTPLAGAVKIAESVHQSLALLAMPHEASLIGPYVTCSIGIASMIPDQSDELKVFIETADDALYSAKEQGRNQTVIG